VRRKFELQEIYPFQSHFATIANEQMHYLDEGSGPAVLMLHGNPTWSFYFRNLIKKLRPHYRVIAPDYIGCGLSSRPKDVRYRALDRVKQVKDLVDYLKLDSFSLIMHDWGGPIGTGLAVRFPELIRKIVYLNTTLTETEALPLIIKRAASPLVGKYLTKYSRHFLKLTTQFGVSRKLSREIKRGYFYPYSSSAKRSAIWDFVDDIPFDSNHPSYGEMLFVAQNIERLKNHPVQIIWGLKDPCFHREMLSKVAHHFPQALVHEIADASHLVLEDAPEETAKVIEEFLTKNKSVNHSLEGKSITQNALYEKFVQRVEGFGRQEAVTVPNFSGDRITYSHLSYRELFGLINKYQRGLLELGLAPGDKVVMLVPPGIDFLALSYAVMGRGAVPVFLDPGMGKENLLNAIEDCMPQGFIGVPKAHLLKLVRPGIFSRMKFSLIAKDLLISPSYNLSFLKKFASTPLPAAPALEQSLIAFTSGGTGTPKGVLFNNAMLKEQLRIFREVFGMRPDKRDLPLLPVFSLFNLAAGITSVFPPIDPAKPLELDPAKIIRLIKGQDISYSFGSPTLWTKIAEFALRSGEKLESLEAVFMAGAPVSLRTLQLVKDLLPAGEAYTPYGATEALPVTLVSSKEVMDIRAQAAVSGELGTLVGQPVEGVSLRIIESLDQELEDISQATEISPLNIGEVIVRGKNISSAYLNNPSATALSKIRDDDDFWHRMGDMGYVDERGNLYFCGRKAHVVKAQERVFYSVPSERVFNAHPGVRRSALVNLLSISQPGIVIEPSPDQWPDTIDKVERFKKELKELGSKDPVTLPIEHFFFHQSFPVDARHNAKIFRDKLSDWAEAELKRGA